MGRKNISFKIVWFDDRQKVHDSQVPLINDHFKKQYNCSLEFFTATKDQDFFQIIEKEGSFIDFVFLDIDLGSKKIDGFKVYERLRDKNKNLRIVFVSAHLIPGEWLDRVEKMEESDENLYHLMNSFPNQRSEAYYSTIVLPIIKILDDKTGYFSYPVERFVELPFNQKSEVLQFADNFNEPYAKDYFAKNKEVSWVVIGDGAQNIIEKGGHDSMISAKDLIDISEEKGVVVSFYGPHKKEIMEKYIEMEQQLISREVVLAQIYHIEENHVVLKCKLNSTGSYQIRRFDIEPLKGAVNLKLDNILEVRIITYTGERKYQFRDVTDNAHIEFDQPLIETKYSNHNKPLE